jgi:hypothetical protein
MSNVPMNKGSINAAYHEAGHVLALLLTTRRFKSVTIIPENMKDVDGIKTSWHIRGIPSEIKNQWKIPSFFKPVNFNRYFKNDFIKVAGLVAEQIYTGRNNKTSVGGDIDAWINVTLLGLPDRLNSKYQHFLLDYTKEVLELQINWQHITAIAEALIERKTLSYSQVIDVFMQSSKMWKENNLSA